MDNIRKYANSMAGHGQYALGALCNRETALDMGKGVGSLGVGALAGTVVNYGADLVPFECVKTNVIGAMNLIDACIDKKVKRVVALSTDKASSPVNLYGATKLTSDKLFVAGNSYAGEHGTRFGVVRYGNVMGSRGSAIPFSLSLLDAGATASPITDARMT